MNATAKGAAQKHDPTVGQLEEVVLDAMRFFYRCSSSAAAHHPWVVEYFSPPHQAVYLGNPSAKVPAFGYYAPVAHPAV